MVKETELYPPLIKLFKEKRFMSDVPLGPKRIDLLFASEDLSEMIAVEVKVKNWKEALRQALVYQMCADESYVAIHQKHCKPINWKKFEELGVGLIVVDTNSSAKVAIPAKPSSRKSFNCATLVRAYAAERKEAQTSQTTLEKVSSTGYLIFGRLSHQNQ